VRILGLIVLLLIPLTAVVLNHQLAIDACLDGGGCYARATDSCVHDHANAHLCTGPHSWLPHGLARVGWATAVGFPLAIVFLVAHDRRARYAQR
jgi:hypothetical protein